MKKVEGTFLGVFNTKKCHFLEVYKVLGTILYRHSKLYTPPFNTKKKDFFSIDKDK
jgi:hypothetical protein